LNFFIHTATSLADKEPPDVSKPLPFFKKQWAPPSGTFVRRLNQMPAQLPTMTMVDSDDGKNTI